MRTIVAGSRSVSGCLRRWREKGGRNYKGDEKTLEGDSHVHYVECCDGFIGVYTCQNSPDCPL